ncbi:MAG TPA: molybdenum cofactor guanylyltransferase [Opitutaceae bacterium]|nr:molybdenum cofactor guanylyltransferase [Opitutaceae bacterium]
MLGVVLAGGEGRRMGRDKAELPVDGEPLWRRQARVLRGAGAERVVLIRRRGQAPVESADCRLDVFARSGPLAGLHAALGIPGHLWVAVLAVDMPGIDPAWFAWLRGFCRPGAGAIARHAQALEPLAAIYPAQAREGLAERLVRRDLSVRRFALELAAAGRLVVVPLPAGAATRVASLNAPPAAPTGHPAGCSSPRPR